MHLVFRLLIVIQSLFLFGFGTWAVLEWSNNEYLQDWLQASTGNGLLAIMGVTFAAWFYALATLGITLFRWNQALGIFNAEQKQLTKEETVVVSKPVVHPADGEFRDWDPGDQGRPVEKPKEEAPTPLTDSVLERRRRYVSLSELRKRTEDD